MQDHTQAVLKHLCHSNSVDKVREGVEACPNGQLREELQARLEILENVSEDRNGN